MCVIINKPPELNVPDDILRKCWIANPHGAGFMYASDGLLHIVKGLMTYDNFIKEYIAHDCWSKEVVIHFRLASAGKIIPEQTHPFWIFPDNLAFVHNGHLMEYDNGGLKQSDTMEFNQDMLSKLPQDFLNNEAIVELLDSYIDYSVMVFMNNMGKITTLGDTLPSISLDGVWYSNDLWKRYEVYENNDTARKDWEHQIYKECDEEDLLAESRYIECGEEDDKYVQQEFVFGDINENNK
jgi:hypothetical protein